MSYTENELMRLVSENMDLEELLDLIDISIEDLAYRFSDKLLDNEQKLLDYLDHGD